MFSDVFGLLPATRGNGPSQPRRRPRFSQAKEGERESWRKRVTEDRERSMGIKIIPECPAMSGTAWEARLFLLRYG